jgi:hypothetical protein
MSVTFTKLFSSITESTVWCEPASTRLVWITMLAMADRKGRVWASVPGLANRARVPIEATKKALTTLLEPDKFSRSKENEGRRIEPIDGGWRLVNYEKYRAIKDEESVRESKRKYINKRRSVEKDIYSRTQSIQAEAEAVKNIPPNGGLVNTEIKQPDQEPVGIWDLGMALLGEQGLKQTSARAFVGSLLKTWDEATVEDAFRAATGAADIKKYVRAVLNTKLKKGESARHGLAL